MAVLAQLSQTKTVYFGLCCSTRILIAILLCFCFAVLQMMTSNLGIAMVCMINHTAVNPRNSNESDPYEGSITWSSEKQGLVFSALSWGRMFMLITGYLADKLNAKYLLFLSLFVMTASTSIIPTVATICFSYVVMARFFLGLGEAILSPAVNSLLTRWFPPVERSAVMGMVTAGRQIGHLLILPTAGALCSTPELFGGWPSIFYVSAASSALYLCFWLPLGADKPEHHWFIAEREVNYILKLNEQEKHSQKRKHRSVPWLKLVTSPAVWASVIAVVCHEFPLMTLFNFLPEYMRDVGHLSPLQNGLFSAMPTASLLLGKVLASNLAGWLHNHGKIGSTLQCKIFNTLGSLGLAVFMGLVTLICQCRPFLAVGMFSLSMFSAGLHTPGCLTALVSMAPAFSGTVTGLAFFFVSLAGIVNPLIIKFIVTTGEKAQWDTVFYGSAAVAALPLVIFNIWGSAEVQEWSTGETKKQVYPA